MKDDRKPRRRLTILLAGLLGWSLAIAVRLVQIQVYRAEDLREMANRQQSSTVELDPVRGAILDRNGVELALTRDMQSIYAVPGLVERADRTATALAHALKLDKREKKKLLARLHMTDRNFVWLARKVDDAEARAVTALALPGIAFVEEPKRFYPRGTLAAHVIGYVGLDNNGLAGLEQQFDGDVRGVPGVKLTLRDARGVRFLPEPGGLPALPGRRLVLTLDATIQWIVERELAAAVRESGAREASAVVLDPWTGEVLAMAGEPTFDPNDYGRSQPAVRRNPVVQEAYEPGSTFKLITFAAALEKQALRMDESFDCGHGRLVVAGTTIHDHEVFGRLSATEVFAKSSNVGAMLIGSRLSPEDFYRQMRMFGFARATGIELPGESPGLLRAPRDWSALSRATLSFGQEIAVTPLQLASAFAAVVNGGTLVRPRIVRRLEEPDGAVVRAGAAEAVRRVVSPDTARTLVGLMEEVVRTGTARAAALDGVTVAGKTGTAQKVVDGVYAHGRYIASFAGFAPARAPRLVVLVVLDEPRGANYHGGTAAAPVVKRILEPALAVLGEPTEGGVVDGVLADFYPDLGDGAPDAFAATAIAQR